MSYQTVFHFLTSEAVFRGLPSAHIFSGIHCPDSQMCSNVFCSVTLQARVRPPTRLQTSSLASSPLGWVTNLREELGEVCMATGMEV